MSFTYLQEQGEESSAECFSDIPAYVLSRLNLTAEKSCSNGREMASCPSSPFGTTSEPLMESRGEDLSMSFAEDSRVRTSAQPEKAQESTVSNLDCGPKWPGSFAKWNPHTRSWKTAQCSLFGGLEDYSGTWPRWGEMRDGECSAQPMSSGLEELRAWITSASESGSSLPTPTKCGNYNRKGASAKSGDGLATVVRRLPTLHGMSKDGRSNGPSGNELGRAVNRMQTPVADDAVDRKDGKINSRGEPKLSAQVKRAGTPAASDWKGSSKPGQRRGQLTDPAMGVIEAGGSLNPPWVEWLMGWPIGWTDLQPLVMDKFQQWLHSHGVFSPKSNKGAKPRR